MKEAFKTSVSPISKLSPPRTTNSVATSFTTRTKTVLAGSEFDSVATNIIEKKHALFGVTDTV